MKFPIRTLGPGFDAKVLTPSAESSVKAPWIMLTIGDVMANPSLAENAPEMLRALADDIQEARTIMSYRASLG